jgi:outer membrane protein assembly factor BamB
MLARQADCSIELKAKQCCGHRLLLLVKSVRRRLAVLAIIASTSLLVSCNSRPPRGDTRDAHSAQGPLPTAVHSVSGDAWPVFRGDAQATGEAKSYLPDNLELLWRFTPPKGRFESTAAIAAGTVYVGGMDGNLYAVELSSGQKKWTLPTTSTFKASPGVREARVFIGDTDGRFYCVDASSGKELWHFDTDGEIDSSPNFCGTNVIFGSRDYNVYCLDAQTGTQVWKFETGYEVRCFCSIADTQCYVGGCDQKLHVLNSKTGEQTSEVELDAPTGSAPAISDGVVYLGTESGTHYAIKADLSKVLWRRPADRRVSEDISSPAATADAVIFGARDKLVQALDPKTGRPLWSFTAKGRIDSSPVVVGPLVVVGSADGRLYAIDLDTGRLQWNYEAGGSILASPAVASGRLVIGTSQGDLLCFGAK